MTERAREQRERPEPDGSAKATADAERPPRPRRPIGVEVAAAIMIVTGIVSILTSVEAAMTFSAQGTLDEPLTVLSIAIGVATVLLGLLVRTGRAWLIAVNVTAVAGFLEIVSGTAAGWLFGALDVAVVVLLMNDRPWFTGPGEDDGAGESDARG